MLFMHEVHAVAGDRADEFETAFRDGWMPLVADGDDARLLWYLDHAHGSGPAYNIVTITAVRDGAAYERLARAMVTGALHDWSRAVDELRHHVDAKMLVPVEWSPLQDIDLAHVPVDGAEHDPSLYMEDTGWPTVALDDYIEFLDVEYFRMMRQVPGLPPLAGGRADSVHLIPKSRVALGGDPEVMGSDFPRTRSWVPDPEPMTSSSPDRNLVPGVRQEPSRTGE